MDAEEREKPSLPVPDEPPALDSPPGPGRGAPLVAVWWRILLLALVPTAAVPALVRAYLDFTHSTDPLASFTMPMAAVMVAQAAFVFVMLRGEEARLRHELR